MIAETISTLSGIKVAIDLAKGVAALKTEVEINQAVLNIQRALLEAQEAALADKQTIADLKRQIAEIDDQRQAKAQWEAEKARYVLTQSPIGAFTYDLRQESSYGEIFHRLCSTCLEAGKKSVLHVKAKHRGGELVECASCNRELLLANFNTDWSTVKVHSRYDELDPDF